MSAPRKVPLQVQPGIVKVDSEYALKGRYIDCDKCRFVAQLPEKIGGWIAWTTDLFTGLARSLFPWDDNSANQWVAVGTHCRLWVYDITPDKTNITPYREAGTLALDPITTTNLLFTVSILDVAHGLEIGDFVNFSGAAAVGGITIAGEYAVTSVTDADNYVITHSIAATSSATGGGAAVLFSYELPCGIQSLSHGGGYGVGPYGEGTYGTERVGGNFIQYPRYWSLDKYGQNLLALPSGGTLYQWDPTAPTVRAAAVTNAPAVGQFMWVTSERHVVILGATTPMRMAWCDDDSLTDWTPSATNSANIRNLQHGSRLIAGHELQQRVNVVWSDTTAYVMQYTGSSFVYDIRAVAHGCGLVGPGAFDIAGATAFWMGGDDFYFMTGSSVGRVPRSAEIRKFVFDAITVNCKVKTECGYNPEFNEIWWYYCADGSIEPNRYVAVNLDSFDWIVGALERTAQAIQASISNIILATDTLGNIFEHEYGVDANGAALPWYIETAYADIDDGNQIMDIWGLVPDFKRLTGDVTVQFSTKENPHDSANGESATVTISVGDGIEDLHMSGRLAKLKYSGSAVGSDFRAGAANVEISASGSRR